MSGASLGLVLLQVVTNLFGLWLIQIKQLELLLTASYICKCWLVQVRDLNLPSKQVSNKSLDYNTVVCFSATTDQIYEATPFEKTQLTFSILYFLNGYTAFLLYTVLTSKVLSTKHVVYWWLIPLEPFGLMMEIAGLMQGMLHCITSLIVRHGAEVMADSALLISILNYLHRSISLSSVYLHGHITSF